VHSRHGLSGFVLLAPCCAASLMHALSKNLYSFRVSGITTRIESNLPRLICWILALLNAHLNLLP
jgi:hypothetical protein